jgi:hypothetical protein
MGKISTGIYRLASRESLDSLYRRDSGRAERATLARGAGDSGKANLTLGMETTAPAARSRGLVHVLATIWVTLRVIPGFMLSPSRQSS